MCLRIDLLKTPMTQKEIDGKRRALQVGYALYAVLIAVFLVGGLLRPSMPALAVVIPAGVAIAMVVISARNNLRVLDEAGDARLVLEVVASSAPGPQVLWYMSELEKTGRPMIVGEARALMKATGQNAEVLATPA